MVKLVSRFYDGDHTYTARDWGEVFQNLAGDGVMPGEGEEFNVTAYNPVQMLVNVAPGVCFIEGRYGRSHRQETLPIAEAHEAFDRVDRVVIRMDQVEGMDVYIKQGEPQSEPFPPALTRSEAIHEISIARIKVSTGTNIITAGDITHEKNDYSVCGYSLPFGWLVQQRVFVEPRRDEFERDEDNYITSAKHYIRDVLRWEEQFTRDSNGFIASITRIAYADDGETVVQRVREQINRNNNGYVTSIGVDQ